MASSHLKALLRKNYILWKRSWCCSCSEILIPALFAFLFLVFRAASPIEDLPKTTFYEKPFVYPATYSSLNQILLKPCLEFENGGKVALSPPGDYVIEKLNTLFTGKTINLIGNLARPRT